MKERIKEIPMRLIVTIAVLLVLIAVMIASMQTYARYITSLPPGVVDFTATARHNAHIYYEDAVGWAEGKANGTAFVTKWYDKAENNTKYTEITVSNFLADGVATEDLFVRVRVFVPETPPTTETQAQSETQIQPQAETQSELSLKLTTGGKTYVGVAVPLREGTETHRVLGGGSVYKFVDEEGKELLLTIKGAEQTDAGVKITLEDINVNTENFKIIAETIQRNGGDSQ